jgi:peptide deformylase
MTAVPNYEIRVIGDPVLKTRAKEVDDIDGRLVALTDGMMESMYQAIGCGLAAPQIGVQRRIVTYDIGDGPNVIINPEIVESSGVAVFEEGCLSIPGMRFDIERPERVTIRGLDLHGNEVVFEDDEFLARMMQHEIDHLDGILTVDRLSPRDRKRALRAIAEQDLTGQSTPHVAGDL